MVGCFLVLESMWCHLTPPSLQTTIALSVTIMYLHPRWDVSDEGGRGGPCRRPIASMTTGYKACAPVSHEGLRGEY